jgi:segregation and condensation protein A
LVKTLQTVLERAKQRPTYEIGGEEVSVPDMIKLLRTLFTGERGTISARELFERQRSRRGMICLFLAMLELVKIQALGLTQTELFGEIGLKKLKGFETAFAGSELLSAIEEGYN